MQERDQTPTSGNPDGGAGTESTTVEKTDTERSTIEKTDDDAGKQPA